MAKVLGVIPFTFCYTKLRQYLFNDCQALTPLIASNLIYHKNILMETYCVCMGIVKYGIECQDLSQATMIEDSQSEDALF